MQRTVCYTELDSPWGPLFLAGTEKGIYSCQFLHGKDISNLISQLQEKPEHAVQENALPLVPAIDVLEQYFSGETKCLNQALDLQGTPFQLMVWSALREIPLGKALNQVECCNAGGFPPFFKSFMPLTSFFICEDIRCTGFYVRGNSHHIGMIGHHDKIQWPAQFDLQPGGGSHFIATRKLVSVIVVKHTSKKACVQRKAGMQVGFSPINIAGKIPLGVG